MISYSTKTDEETSEDTKDKELIINAIDTIFVDSDAGEIQDETLDAVWNGDYSVKKWYMKQNIARKVMVRTNTIVLKVPNGGSTEDDAYYTSTVGSSMSDDGNYAVDVYKLKGKNGYGDIVLQGYDDVQLDVNEYRNKTVKVYIRNYEQATEDGEVLQYVEVYTPTGKQSYGVEGAYIDFTGVEPGDIIDFDLNRDGRIEKGAGIGYILQYDYDKSISEQPAKENGKWGHTKESSTATVDDPFMVYNYKTGDGDRYTYPVGYRRDYQLSYGRPVRLYADGILSIAASDTDDTETEVMPTSSLKVIVVEEGRDDANIRDGVIGDVVSIEDAGENCSKIIYYTKVGNGGALVVYNL